MTPQIVLSALFNRSDERQKHQLPVRQHRSVGTTGGLDLRGVVYLLPGRFRER